MHWYLMVEILHNIFFCSKAYHEFLGFIMALNNAVKGKTMQCDYIKSQVQLWHYGRRVHLPQKGAFPTEGCIYCLCILYGYLS